MATVAPSSGQRKYSLQDVYPGVRPFSPEEWDRFFGRSREIADVRYLFMAERAVLLYAQSGAGKTSLVQAGLIPRLDPSRCRICRVGGDVPDAVPLSSVTNVFAFNTLLAFVDRRDDLSQIASATLSASLTEQGRSEAFYLIFDQFEEILETYPQFWEHRRPFFGQVRDLLKCNPFLHILFVIREEQLAALETFGELLPDGLSTRYYLERLRAEAAETAILGPARLAGVDVDRPELREYVKSVVKEMATVQVEVGGRALAVTGEFVEPIHLQIVCGILAQRGFQPGPAGGATVDRALEEFYDAAIRNASRRAKISERHLRNFVETGLITRSNTRGLIHKDQRKGHSKSLPATALEELEKQRIIRENPRAGAIWLELTHDRLIHPILESNARWRARRRWHTTAPIAAGVLVVLVAIGGYLVRSFEDTLRHKDSVIRYKDSVIESKQKVLNVVETAAQVQPASAMVLGLAQWRLHDYGQARVWFNRAREVAPLDAALAVEDAIQAAKAGNDPALPDLRAARWELLRYPVIRDKMPQSPPLRDYVCQHDYAVIGASAGRDSIEKTLTWIRAQYPYAEAEEPVGDNPNWSIVLEAFLTCDEAREIASASDQKLHTRPYIILWYSCPLGRCLTPTYGH